MKTAQGIMLVVIGTWRAALASSAPALFSNVTNATGCNQAKNVISKFWYPY
jgi:hypothetical protein